jgi:hypothetical protein
LVREPGDGAERLAERVRTRVESLASRPASPLVGHTVTVVVLPVRPTTSSGPRHRPGTITPDEIISTARALVGPSLRVISNRVVRLQTLTI